MKEVIFKILKKLIVSLGVFIVTLAVLLSLLISVSLIPNDAIRENMEKSAEYFSQTKTFEFTNGYKLAALRDNYADVILCSIVWNMGDREDNTPHSVLVATLDTKYYDGNNGELKETLYKTLHEGAEPDTDYTRYYHGSAMLIKLSHLFTDINGTRLIGFSIVCLAIALTLIYLIKRRHPYVALCVAISLVLVRFWHVGLSIEYQAPFAITFLLCPIYLYAEKNKERLLLPLSVIGGLSVCFFDFLTTETIAVLLPFALIITLRTLEGRLGTLKDELITLITNCTAFAVSYASGYVAKWTVASLITGENKFIRALESVNERINGSTITHGGGETLIEQIINAPLANLSVLFGSVERVDYLLCLAGVAICVSAILAYSYLFGRKKDAKTPSILLFFIALIVPIRYIVLYNHSFLHEFFTYRALVVPIFCILTVTTLYTKFSSLPMAHKDEESEATDERSISK